jgi:nucleoside-diphosphate-sugar epimerase
VSRKPINSSFINYLVDDLSSNIDWKPMLKDVDVIIHLAAHVHMMKKKDADNFNKFLEVNSFATRNLAQQASESGVKRFIFLSTIKVHGEQTNPMQPFNASDIEHNHSNTLDLKKLISEKKYDNYSLSKYIAEYDLTSICIKNGMEYTIIRPPLVYGPNVKGNFKSLLSLLEKKIPLPFAGIKNSRSFVFVENLVDLIVVCISHESAANKAFLVSDGQSLSTSELLLKLSVELKTNNKFFKFPRSGFKLISSIFGKSNIYSRLFKNLEINAESTFRELDWTPPYTVDYGLAKMAQHFTMEKLFYR